MTKFHPTYPEYRPNLRTTGSSLTAANPVRTVSGLFRNPALAEQAIRAIERFGHDRHAFNVMMNRRIRNFFLNPWDEESPTDHRTWEGARLGALAGAACGAVIALGAAEALPNFLVDGPLVVGLIGVLAGGLPGLLFGAVIGSGVSGKDDRRQAREGCEDEFLISVVPATNDEGHRIAEAWEAIGGENIHH